MFSSTIFYAGDFDITVSSKVFCLVLPDIVKIHKYYYFYGAMLNKIILLIVTIVNFTFCYVKQKRTFSLYISLKRLNISVNVIYF